MVKSLKSHHNYKYNIQITMDYFHKIIYTEIFTYIVNILPKYVRKRA